MLGRRLLSTVAAGTAYENLVVSVFNRLGADLERVGGANDRGIDFRGHWALPDHRPFYLVGQCKHYENRRIGPSVVREWEGVMSRQEIDTLGLIAATRGFTTAAVRASLSSAYPIALVTLDSPLLAAQNGLDLDKQDRSDLDKQSRSGPGAQTEISGFVWNRAADPFIGRLAVAKKHFDVHRVEVADPAQFTIQLFWDGRPLPTDPPRTLPPQPASCAQKSI
ncbi:hypothetical protein GGF46_004348 [Coemansia sp. RSA 552]|nr:hypothetical protein GGF46_004348 [Coemansia sp. RSA 552]